VIGHVVEWTQPVLVLIIKEKRLAADLNRRWRGIAVAEVWLDEAEWYGAIKHRFEA
jgi:hypothetical protein